MRFTWEDKLGKYEKSLARHPGKRKVARMKRFSTAKLVNPGSHGTRSRARHPSEGWKSFSTAEWLVIQFWH